MRFLFCVAIFFLSLPCYSKTLPLNLLKHPPGFKVTVFAEIPDARQMALGSKGTIFVGTKSGDVYAITPNEKGDAAAKVYTLATNLNTPNGVAFRDGSLYVAEINRILRFDNIESELAKPRKPKVISTNLPTETHHGLRYIRFGPDGKLYIGIGMPCNVCLMKDTRFGTIMRMEADGTKQEIFARGIRNSMGFDWHPTTKALWFTDNGRDYLGDDLPPDKLNVAPKAGLDFGFPYYNGKGLKDPEFGKSRGPEGITFPTYALPAHVAALGMAFYTGTLFPEKYRQQILIAEHGSWNRSKKVGYQIVLAEINGNEVKQVTPLITGWLQGDKPWGRPVDIINLPDGSMLISDDFAGVIYRLNFWYLH